MSDGNNNLPLDYKSETSGYEHVLTAMRTHSRIVNSPWRENAYLCMPLLVYLIGVLIPVLLNQELSDAIGQLAFGGSFWLHWVFELILLLPFYLLLLASARAVFWMPFYLVSGVLNGFFVCCIYGAVPAALPCIVGVMVCRTMPLISLWSLRLGPKEEKRNRQLSGLFLVLFATALCAFLKYRCIGGSW